MRYIINVTVKATWSATDTLWLYRGSENAASLAASTPSGGTVVTKKQVGSAQTGALIAMPFEYRATDKCGRLPVGVTCVNAAGNESSVLEMQLDLDQPPVPPGQPDVAAGAGPGEATLTWAASPDL